MAKSYLRIHLRQWLICVACCVVVPRVAGAQMTSAQESEDVYRFLDLREKLQTKLKDSERLKIQLALGEYYFKIKALREAKVSFQEIVQQNKGGIPTLLANVYLYHLARIKGENSDYSLELKKKIFEDQFILLFDKYKTVSFTSSWGYRYEIHYFVDKIVVYRDGEVLEEITP